MKNLIADFLAEKLASVALADQLLSVADHVEVARLGKHVITIKVTTSADVHYYRVQVAEMGGPTSFHDSEAPLPRSTIP